MASVHIWWGQYAQLSQHAERLQATLSAEEQARAADFVTPQLAARFSLGRGALRVLLAGYVRQEAAALTFAYGPQGKPYLLAHPALHFNLSHDGDYLIVGVGRLTLGIDIAQERAVYGPYTAFLQPEEAAHLTTLPAHERPRAFFRAWVAKEAYVKARGLALSDPRSIPSKPPAPWRVVALDAPSGYQAALVVQQTVTLRVFNLCRHLSACGACP